MATVLLRLSATDHGRRLTLDDFDDAEFEPGYKYEIIDGRLFVSTAPNPAENILENWLFLKLVLYSGQNQTVINYVTVKSRVFIHTRKKDTVPEPDIAAFQDFPLGQPFEELRWQDLGPLVVAEVLVDGDPFKDLQRNADLYFELPSIREYWVLDGRDDPNEPTLIQHRRYGKRWLIRSFPYGSTFTTKLLPGFSLLIDPRK
jgi:Uma2 family endonuclease